MQSVPFENPAASAVFQGGAGGALLGGCPCALELCALRFTQLMTALQPFGQSVALKPRGPAWAPAASVSSPLAGPSTPPCVSGHSCVCVRVPHPELLLWQISQLLRAAL